MNSQPETKRMYGPLFHLRDNFYFSRSNDGMVMISHEDVSVEVPLMEWASAVHATADGVDYATVARMLGAEFPPPHPKPEGSV